MRGNLSRLEILDEVVTDAVRLGIAQQTTEDETLDGRTIRLGGRDVVNFASCSYLGLETDPRLAKGTLDAVRRYGTQFSSSRVYVSAPPYAELESLLQQIFDAHVIATPSTTLGHLCSIPTLVDSTDAVILDHQVHHSVQTAVMQVASQGTHIELLRHSRMDLLEERVRELSASHQRVWYMADGVYSMYGDLAPFSDLQSLLDRFEQLHLYVDDAHGMSWHGKHGRGVTLSHMPLHARMVVATSMNKSFAAAGGVLILPDEETHRWVRTCGGPLLFSGPIQPPMLGAAIASARLHLSPEIEPLQQHLRTRMSRCAERLAGRDLPVLSSGDTPVNFVGAGLTRTAQNAVARLLAAGFYTNVAQFPAVPTKKAGIRFTLTLHHSLSDIDDLIDAIEYHLPRAIREEGETCESVWSIFGCEPRKPVPANARETQSLRLERAQTIEAFDSGEWNQQLGDRGAFDAAALRSLEACFHASRSRPEDTWGFRYYQVKDETGQTRLSTFFTEALWKADMLAPAAVSEELEERRRDDPYHLTLRTLSMGSLLTEGDHLYLDRSSDDWEEPLGLLLSALMEDGRDAEMITLRDLPADDPAFDRFVRDRGFLKSPGAQRMVLELEGRDEEALVRSLSRNARRHYHRQVEPWNDAYDVEFVSQATRALSQREEEHIYGLYRGVHQRGLDLNTFPLPDDVFHHLLASPSWEIALFTLRPEHGGDPAGLPVAAVATFVGRQHTVPTFLGMDYRWVRTHGLYRQCLRRSVVRAMELGKQRVDLGIGAPLEKQRFGARPQQSSIYLLASDHYPLDVVAQMGSHTGGTQRLGGKQALGKLGSAEVRGGQAR